MNYWVEEIKKKPFQRPIQIITDRDILYLFSEIERLEKEVNKMKKELTQCLPNGLKQEQVFYGV